MGWLRWRPLAVTEQARLEVVTERVVLTTPSGSLNPSSDFQESLTALDENMTRARQLKIYFNTKSLDKPSFQLSSTHEHWFAVSQMGQEPPLRPALIPEQPPIHVPFCYGGHR